MHTTNAAVSEFFDRVLNSDTAGVCCVAGTCTPPRAAHSCNMHSTSRRALYANARECVFRSESKVNVAFSRNAHAHDVGMHTHMHTAARSTAATYALHKQPCAIAYKREHTRTRGTHKYIYI